MKKLFLTAAAASLGMGMAFTPTTALADDHKAGEMEKLDQTWYRVDMVKFKGGNRERVNEIIEMFNKADKAAGVDSPVIIHMNTGPWDMMVFFKMKDGIEQMGWKSNPEDEKWDKAFNAMVGGEEAAKKIYIEMESYIAAEETHIAHRHPEKTE